MDHIYRLVLRYGSCCRLNSAVSLIAMFLIDIMGGRRERARPKCTFGTLPSKTLVCLMNEGYQCMSRRCYWCLRSHSNVTSRAVTAPSVGPTTGGWSAYVHPPMGGRTTYPMISFCRNALLQCLAWGSTRTPTSSDISDACPI